MAYSDIAEGDDISPLWGNTVERALGGKGIFTTNLYPAQAATYIVFKSGSYYCARDGLTGKIDFDDTDFTTLMNETILDMFDSTAGQGGEIRIKSNAGVYTYNNQINMRPGIWVRGAGVPGTVAGTSLGVCLNAGADVTCFNFDYPSGLAYHYFSGISHLQIYGYSGTGTASHPGIDLQCNSNHMSDVFFDNLFVRDCDEGIRIYNNAAATYKIWNIFVHHCMSETNEAQGILIDSPTNQIIERVRVKGCHFYGNNISAGNGAIEIDGHSTYCGCIGPDNTFDTEQKHSIYLADEADHWTINGNVIKDGGAAAANTYDGISLVDVDYITATGNTIGNITTANLKYAINSDNSCTYCGFGNNTVNSATAPAIIQGTGVGMKSSNNPGYLNMNGGISAAIATGATVAHGLAGTPTRVNVNAAEAGPTGITVTAVGAANFVINFGGGGNKTFYWIAEYDP